MNKWDYIHLISEASNKFGDRLLKLMEKYNKDNLQEITLEEAQEFWEQMNK